MAQSNTVVVVPCLLRLSLPPLLLLLFTRANAEIVPISGYSGGGLRLLDGGTAAEHLEAQMDHILEQILSEQEQQLDRQQQRQNPIGIVQQSERQPNDEAEQLLDAAAKGKGDAAAPSLAPKQKKSVRRCGSMLLKHIQTVCNGCLRSAADAGPVMMAKRNGETPVDLRNRIIKRQGLSKITDICCTQRSCSDDEVKPFCC